MDLCRSDVIRLLRERGIIVSRDQVMHAIAAEKLARPEKNGAGQYRYTQEHVDRLAELFK